MAYNLILMCGMPGSGKSSISREVLQMQGMDSIRHLPIGDRIRKIGKGQIESAYSDVLMAKIEGLKNHDAMPQDVAIGVFEEFMAQESSGTVLVDGFPRYTHRVQAFLQSIAKLAANVTTVCHVVVPDDIAKQRLQHRDSRITDSEKDSEFITRRIDEYYTEVKPTIDQLAQMFPYHQLDGTQPVKNSALLVRQFIQPS